MAITVHRRMTLPRSMISPLARPWRAAIIVLLAGAMLLLWSYYRNAAWLHVGFGHYLGDVLPLYADDRGRLLELFPGSNGRLLRAIVLCTAALALVIVSIARRWRTSVCLLITVLAVLAVNVSVAAIPRGQASVLAPFARRELEYYGDVRYVRDDPLLFIQQYPTLTTRRFFRLSHHAGTHPPGPILFLWLGGKIFGPSLEAACALAIGVTALGVVPAYVLARTVGGAAAGRRLLPLYVAAPNLILFGATCMDGVFMTFALSAMAGAFLAMRRWSIVRPIVAGVLLWLATFMTYAVVAVPLLMGLYAMMIGLRRAVEAARMLARATFVGTAFIACQLAAGRWLHHDLVACADAAIRVDLRGVRITGHESLEIWRSYSLGNALGFTFGSGLTAAALFVVAAVLVAMTWSRAPRRIRAFVPAVALCVIALACSTLFSLEVERVWLFLTPALLTAATLAYRGCVVWVVVPVLMVAQALIIEWNFNTWW
jgi:hypothetical protein